VHLKYVNFVVRMGVVGVCFTFGFQMNVNGLRRNDIECSVSTAFTTFPEKTSKSLLSMVNTEIKNTMSTVLVNYTLYIFLTNPCIMVIKGNLDIGNIMCVWLGEQERYAWVAIDLYINLSQSRKWKANMEPWN